jgi:hypothetical protein
VSFPPLNQPRKLTSSCFGVALISNLAGEVGLRIASIYIGA